MDYDGLPAQYRQVQQDRVLKSLQRIPEVGAPTPGRVVPENEDLALGDARRIPMAVMFLDISRFSQRPSDHEGEQTLLVRVLNLFFTEMIRIAEDYGGTVEKNTGDGLMAYFEDRGGQPPESGVKRAVACGLTMFEACRSLINPILASAGVQELEFRVALDYGQVTIARLGAPRRFNAIVAVGSPANVASKMLSKAGAGDFVLGERAKLQLPLSWQLAWAQLLTLDSGWTYRATGHPYPLYRYVGRWR